MIVDLGARFPIGDRVHKAALGAPVTDVAELLDAEPFRLIVCERKLGVDFPDPNTWTEFPGDR